MYEPIVKVSNNAMMIECTYLSGIKNLNLISILLSRTELYFSKCELLEFYIYLILFYIVLQFSLYFIS